MTTPKPKFLERLAVTLFPALVAATMLATTVRAAEADSLLVAADAESPAQQSANTDGTRPPDHPEARTKEKDPLIIKVLGLGIGLVATILGIGIGFVAVWTEYKKRHDLITFCHQERMAALEKGLDLPPLPPELIHDVTGRDERPKSPGTGLKAGLMWLAIGIGTAIFLSLQQRAGIHPSIGTIPIAIGIVYLICYAIERRGKGNQTNQSC